MRLLFFVLVALLIWALCMFVIYKYMLMSKEQDIIEEQHKHEIEKEFWKR